MTTVLQALLQRGDRRIRLLFSGALASGAFGSTLGVTSLYVVTSVDGSGPSPDVDAAIAVTTDPNAVELALDADLVGGGVYQVTCTSVPVAVGPAYSGSMQLGIGLEVDALPNAEPATSDLDLLLYGRDITHDGTDFVQDASGDLLTVTGRDNWRAAMRRRLMSYGLPWDETYGARPDQYVNAPDPYRLPLSGALLAQARADDRTKQASVDVARDDADPTAFLFQVTIVGRDNLDPITVNVGIPA